MRRAAAAATLLLLLTGCAQSVDPIERLGRKAAEKMSPRCVRGPEQPLAGPRATWPNAGRSPDIHAPRAEPDRTAKRCPKTPPR
ncbi:hypothetical protein GCM10010245_45930 [Streptomyces spectabilis]|uniref:Lipoprotein n=1 Tax=Streptomyces spectabilis TaxID=68270 RepID=A0A7W8B542_STRST|nr:hypothetical protein [Streptomyces spectabilis]GGV27972.1 hypothetical protein GCM10010245_45930 [Streptomyces spectabilis]